MFAHDVMSPEPYAVLPTDSIARAAQLMRNVDVGLMPVVDDLTARRVKGVITDRDIAMRCVAAGHGPGCTVGDHMTWPPLHTVRENDTISHALQEMEDARIRRVLVVDDDDRLIGVIAQADIARKLGPEIPERVVEFLERVSSAVPALT